jgi:hypothetical protein
MEERVLNFLVEAFESAVNVSESVSDFFVAAFDAVLDFFVASLEAGLKSFVRVGSECRVVTRESWERVWLAGDSSP